MRKRLPKILVTGGAGFIGSAFVRLLVSKGYRPIVVDKLTYAGDLSRLNEARGEYKFYKIDICDKNKVGLVFKKERPEIVVHFAAESHVDRSIKDSSPFIKTNITGTQGIIDSCRKYKIKRFIHLSTDEVYGEIKKGSFKESHALKPNSPYSASKAAADLLIRSYVRTYLFPAIIIRPCNNYGPWQYPEKLIPLAILKILKGQKIPIYATGKNVREWLYVEDCALGILQILKKGRPGEIYNLGSNKELKNIEVVRLLLETMKSDKSMIQFVKDRPGHDIRYKLNSSLLAKKIGWHPQVGFKEGMGKTVNWAFKNKKWLLNKWQEIAKLYK